MPGVAGQAHEFAFRFSMRLTCYTGHYSGQLRPSAEIDEIAWLTYADRDRMSLVTQNVADWLRDRGELQ